MRSTQALLLALCLLSPARANDSCPLDGLTPPSGPDGQQFGAHVAAHGDTLLVGAPLLGVSPPEQGRVFVYERSGTTWQLVDTWSTAAESNAIRFGYSVDVEGDIAVVGAPRADTLSGDEGAVFVYARTGGAWQFTERVTAPDGSAGDRFGTSVAVSGRNLVVGAPRDDGEGSAWVYTLTAGGWVPLSQLKAFDAAMDDAFGHAVDVGGSAAIVGAPGDDDLGAGSGSVYVYELSGSWSFDTKLTASGGAAGDEYGTSVALTDPLGQSQLAFVGAPGTSSGTGKAYVLTGFPSSPLGWVQSLTLFGQTPGGRFGSSLDADPRGKRIAIGAPHDFLIGEVHVMEPVGNPWLTNTVLVSSDASSAGEGFGASVAVAGDFVAAGSPMDSDAGVERGSACVFAVSYQPWNASYGMDCNGNDVSDYCDVANGSCPDVDNDGIPDVCQSTFTYCAAAANSTGTSASIAYVGSLSIAANDFRLVGEGCPFGSSGLFFYGAGQAQQPFGDGFLCVGDGGVGVFRLYPGTTVQFGGTAVADVDFTSPPSPAGTITAGSTWYFQFWFRDPSGPGGSGFNLTDGLSASFCP